MEIVRGENVILVALMYNYIANHETNLSSREINKFIEAVNNSLQKSGNYYEIQMNDSNFGEAFFGFDFDKEKERYILISLRFIEWVYDCQPEEVITATLKKSALSTIGVDRKNLKIEKQYRSESGQMDIYSLKATDAQERTKKILESEGCRKIIIDSTIPDMLGDDKGYRVSYSCERPFEKVNGLEKTKE